MWLRTAKLLKSENCMQLKGRPATETGVHMQPKSQVAAETKKILKAVYKQTRTKKMMKYEAGNKEATENADPTRMYLERWGSLTPPPGKASFLKNLPALLFPQRYYTSSIVGVQMRRAGVLACKKRIRLLIP
jgi:hypothetical protein